MLTFVGHANGEVTLLDSDSHTLSTVIKLHGAGVICLESVEGFSGGRGGCVGRLVSAGANNNVKVTDVLKSGNDISLRPRVTVRFDATPLYVSMFENIVCAVLQPHRVTMVKVDLAAKKFIDGKLSGLSHSTFDDHTAQVSGLDCCSALRLFVTAANDGLVKIWDAENNLVRELSFGDTLQGVCFANQRGDILAGFERLVVSVSICRYLPSYLLETVVKKHFKDENREDPLPFNNKLRLSFESKKLPTFSTNPERRRSQLKTWQLSSSEDRLAIAEGSWRILDDVAQHCLHAQKLQDKQKVTNLLGMIFPGKSDQAYKSGFRRLAKMAKQQHQMTEQEKITASNERDWRAALEENVRLTELKLDQKIAVMKAESKPHRCKLVTAEDAAVGPPTPPPPDPRIVKQRNNWRYLYQLFNKWMIPVDGYVPNSVVRKRFGQKFGLSEEDKHGTRLRMRTMKYRYQVNKRRAPMRRRLKKLNAAGHKVERSATTGPSSSSAAADSKLGQKGDSSKNKQLDNKLKLGQFEGEVRPRRASMAVKDRRKSKRLDDLNDDEPVTFLADIQMKGAEIFLRIMKEDWFPKGNIDKLHIIATLLSIIESDDPTINRSVCKYMIEIRDAQGLPNQIEEDLVKALLSQLNSKRHTTQKDSIWMLGELGFDSKEIIMGLMPKLVDNSPTIRNEATLAIQKVLGVNNKDDLLAILEARGFVKGFMDNLGNEEEIFQRLARQAEGVLFPVIENRLMGWLDDTSKPYADASLKKPANLQYNTASATHKKRRASKAGKDSFRADDQVTPQKGKKGTSSHQRKRRSSVAKPPAAFVTKSSTSKSKSTGTADSKKKSIHPKETGVRKRASGERKSMMSSLSSSSSEDVSWQMPNIDEDKPEEEDEGLRNRQKSYTVIMDIPELPNSDDLHQRQVSATHHRSMAIDMPSPMEPALLADTVHGVMNQARLGGVHTGRQRMKTTMLPEEEEPDLADTVTNGMMMAGFAEHLQSSSRQHLSHAQFMDRKEDLLTRKFVDDYSAHDDLLWNYDNKEFQPDENFPQSKDIPTGALKDKEKQKTDKLSTSKGSGMGTTMPRAADQKRSRAENRNKLQSLAVSEEERVMSATPSTPVDHAERKLHPRHSFIYRHYENQDASKKMAVKETPQQVQEKGVKAEKVAFSREGEGSIASDSALLSQESQDQFSDQLSQQLNSSVNEITDSGFDSGISQDVSETSSYKGGGIGGTLMDRGLPCLSPVKSLPDTPERGQEDKRTRSTPKLPEPPEGWRDFFDRPSAQERRRLQMVRQDFAEGRTRPMTVILPPISYVKDKVTFQPGNSGFRLLQRVSIKDKELKLKTGKHMIDSLPGNLGINTIRESEGSSKYGILRLDWTTDVPVPLQGKGGDSVGKGHLPQTSEASHVTCVRRLPPIGNRLIGRLEGRSVFPQPICCEETQVYRWESPLPPPPRFRDTCLQPVPTVKSHGSCCKYYCLARQGMHHYTSAELLPLRLESHEKALKRTLRFYCKPSR
ncbi:uncharacterized protein LOC135464689 [Liolophura sinensis]|uniref:uncharacterized protein LOC135464689 n=1 Tax=Liolophura sinensis TaxID=3198878 RepID=UPI003157FB49